MIDDALIDELDINPTLDSMKLLLGYDSALKLSCNFGGKRIFIPREIYKNSPLAACVGIEAAKKISSVWGGMDFYVPMTAKKKNSIIEMTKSGLSAAAIATELYCSERYVHKVRSEVRNDDQLTLF